MSADSRFSNTNPAALGPGPEGTVVPRANEYTVAAAMAAQLADPLRTMQRAIVAFVGSGKLTQLQAQPISDAIEMAHRTAQQAELLEQLAAGRVRHVHEQVALDKVVQHALDEWAHWLRQRGVELQRSIRPVAVVADPDLVNTLVDAALEWSAEPGRRLMVSLEMKNWPAHAVLRFKSNQTVTAGARRAAREYHPEKLCWHLVTELATAIGATLDRVESAEESLVMIEFPRTVRQLEGLTAMEMDFGDEAWTGAPSKALSGYRLLVITGDPRLSEDVKRICKGMGMVVDSVPSTQMAVRFSELEKPELIVIDEKYRDQQFNELREDLLRMQPNFPFVEIAYDANTLLVSGWMGESMTRVNRDELATQLPQALALEVAKAL